MSSNHHSENGRKLCEKDVKQKMMMLHAAQYVPDSYKLIVDDLAQNICFRNLHHVSMQRLKLPIFWQIFVADISAQMQIDLKTWDSKWNSQEICKEKIEPSFLNQIQVLRALA